MQLHFEVKIGGEWVPVTGTILADGRLGCEHGAVRPPYWRHSETTTRDPEFRRLCYNNLTPEERESAVARMGRPQFEVR